MAFEKFKDLISKMTDEQLNGEIQKRKRLLIEWNNPKERMIEIQGYDKPTKTIHQKSHHPYRKIKKEIARLHHEVHKRFLITLKQPIRRNRNGTSL